MGERTTPDWAGGTDPAEFRICALVPLGVNTADTTNRRTVKVRVLRVIVVPFHAVSTGHRFLQEGYKIIDMPRGFSRVGDVTALPDSIARSLSDRDISLR